MKPIQSYIIHIAIIISFFSIINCGDEIKISDQQAGKIKGEARQILKATPSNENNINVDKLSFIKSLDPKSVDVRSDGLYIVLKSFFAKESGIFIPREGFTVNTESGVDPSYEPIVTDIFYYRIKG